MKTAIESRKQEAIKNFDGKLQPFLIVLGAAGDKITSTYVFVNDILYPVTSFVKGIMLLFMNEFMIFMMKFTLFALNKKLNVSSNIIYE